jgi:hypothetical protein
MQNQYNLIKREEEREMLPDVWQTWAWAASRTRPGQGPLTRPRGSRTSVLPRTRLRRLSTRCHPDRRGNPDARGALHATNALLALGSAARDERYGRIALLNRFSDPIRPQSLVGRSRRHAHRPASRQYAPGAQARRAMGSRSHPGTTTSARSRLTPLMSAAATRSGETGRGKRR